MTGRNTKERTTNVGRMLTERRLELKLSQQRISNMAGISMRVYQRLETGEMDFRDTRIRYGLAICMILGLDPYKLVFGQEFTCGGVFRVMDPEQKQHRETKT